jgi:hypothetical protein
VQHQHPDPRHAAGCQPPGAAGWRVQPLNPYRIWPRRGFAGGFRRHWHMLAAAVRSYSTATDAWLRGRPLGLAAAENLCWEFNRTMPAPKQGRGWSVGTDRHRTVTKQRGITQTGDNQVGAELTVLHTPVAACSAGAAAVQLRGRDRAGVAAAARLQRAAHGGRPRCTRGAGGPLHQGGFCAYSGHQPSCRCPADRAQCRLCSCSAAITGATLTGTRFAPVPPASRCNTDGVVRHRAVYMEGVWACRHMAVVL